MILRSVTKHVKDQNWFAVAIDFFIVVFGVYVGLQVQEWSDQRALDASEAQFLSEVREEITYNAALNASLVESMEVLVASGKRAVRFLESDRACDDDCWRILVDLFTASQVFTPAMNAVVYDEMQRLGFPRATEVKAAINDFYVLNATAYLGIDNNPKYRSSFRELLTIEAHEQLWSHCHSVKGPVELLIVDCPQSLPTEKIKTILDRIRARPEVLDQLHYWIGMHSFWVPNFADILAAADHAIEVIDSVQQQ
ncbi:MAG: hypothetical protein Cons2KO_01830 [Congregibacter sp.]